MNEELKDYFKILYYRLMKIEKLMKSVLTELDNNKNNLKVGSCCENDKKSKCGC